LVYHLSKIGDNWETFLIRNGFTQVDSTTNPLLTINLKSDRPVAESQFANSFEGPKFIGPVSVVNETLVDKYLSCRFSPRRSLEQVIFELKENNPHMHVNDSVLNVNVKSVSKNLCKGNRQ
jgi:hypothetical protein